MHRLTLDIEFNEDEYDAADIAVLIKDRLEGTGALVLADGRDVVYNIVNCTAQDPATPEEIEEARQLHGSEECEIDEGAGTSRADLDDGLWVQAWVWLPRVGSVFLTDNPAESRIELRQDAEDVDAFFEYDAADPESRKAALALANEEAEALIEGWEGALVYDDTELDPPVPAGETAAEAT